MSAVQAIPSPFSQAPATEAAPSPHASMPSSPPHDLTTSPSHASSPHSPSHLLRLFLQHDADPDAMLAAGVPLDQILTLASDPAAQQHLADYRKLKQTGLEIHAIAARRECFKILASLARESKDATESRRAATSLLRATYAPLIPVAPKPADAGPTLHANSQSTPRNAPSWSRAADWRSLLKRVSQLAPQGTLAHAQSDQGDAAPRATPGNDPECPDAPASIDPPRSALDLTHKEIAEAVILAAANPDEPVEDLGYLTIATLLAANATIQRRRVADLQPDLTPALKEAFKPIQSASHVRLTAKPLCTDTTADYTFGFTTPAGPHQLILNLAREPDAAWHIAAIATHPIDSS